MTLYGKHCRRLIFLRKVLYVKTLRAAMMLRQCYDASKFIADAILFREI